MLLLLKLLLEAPIEHTEPRAASVAPRLAPLLLERMSGLLEVIWAEASSGLTEGASLRALDAVEVRLGLGQGIFVIVWVCHELVRS